jgi:hypothetical protein
VILRLVFGLVFGVVFAGAGFMVLLETSVSTYTNWQTMQNWQVLNATLLEVKGNDSDTKARYSYQVANKSYQSERVYIAEFTDNFGSYHKDLQKKLKQNQRNRQEIQIWVGPNNPANAVIDKEMRWGLFAIMTAFSSVFIVIGLAIIYVSVIAKPSKNKQLMNNVDLRKEWEEQRENNITADSFIQYRRHRLYELGQKNSTTQNNTEPSNWKERKGWQTNKIRSDSKGNIISLWFFTIFWNAMISFAAIQGWHETSKEQIPLMIISLLGLAGIFLLFQTIKATLQYLRFGVVELVMDPYPGAINGNVGGKITIKGLNINDFNNHKDAFEVTIECVHSYRRRNGSKNSRSEDIRWAERGYAKIDRGAFGIGLSFKFSVPKGLPEADAKQTGDYNFWRLKVRAKLPTVNFDRNYNIPVFATGEESARTNHDISQQAINIRQQEAERTNKAISQGEFDQTLLSKKLTISETSDSISIKLPMLRNLDWAAFTSIFSGCFGFASYQMLHDFTFEFSNILMAIFSLPFLAVAVVTTVLVIYLPLNNMKTHIDNDVITVIRKIFIFPVFIKRIETNTVTSFSIDRSGSTGQGVNKTEHYRILVKLNNGDTLTIVSGVDGQELAEQFKDYIAQKIQFT